METPNPSLSSPPPLEQDQQPAAKKSKMSTTTTSDDDGGAAEKPRRYKRRKVAIFFAYCGVGYQGMQKNPGAKTIEGDLEEALYHAGAVPEQDRGQPRSYDWARSARTDKGVSALGQVVSGRFYVDPPGFIQRLNSHLSLQIRIYGFKRVTPTFNAKKFCDRRRYVYLLPVFALDPSCHRDRETVLASLGSGNELVKCLECSERGRKVVGLMGNKRDHESKVELETPLENDVGVVGSEVEVQLGISSNSEAALVCCQEKEQIQCNVSMEHDSGALEPSEDDVGSEVVGQLGISSNSEAALLSSEEREDLKCDFPMEHDNGGQVLLKDVGSENLVLSGILSNTEAALLTTDGNGKEQSNVSLENSGVADLESNLNSGSVVVDLSGCGNGGGKERIEFKYGDEVRERFNRILKYYEGTHNFHNFTTRTKAEDPSAKRYIVSFEANTTLTIEGIEFVKCEVVGQSFMLHQIRKMMGLAVAIMRDFAPESIFERAFQQNININVPTAPEVGLYLDECLFTSYNNRWKDTHEELSMKAYAEEAEEFKLKHIYTHIANTEHKEGSIALWLHSLNHRNYPDLRPTEGGADPTIESNSSQVEKPAEGDTIAVSA